MFEVAHSFVGGAAIGLSLGSPTEWNIHKYLLHASSQSRARSAFINGASRGHNDNHHGAYQAPEHYYRDITNEREIIHFSRGDVGIIASSAVFVGSMMNLSHALLYHQTQFSAGDGAFIAGVVAGTLGYYGCYEFTHHYMHVIGERRLSINRVFGDAIQGGKEHRDGNLRFSKPLLDDIGTYVEENVDRAFSRRSLRDTSVALAERLKRQILANISAQNYSASPYIEVAPEDSCHVLNATLQTMMEREQAHRAALSFKGKILYSLDRRLQKTLRASPPFQYLDNHHFLHHRHYGKNLNVVFPLMDYLKGTKEESTRSVLEENKSLWLCPNSPDTKLFKRKSRK